MSLSDKPKRRRRGEKRPCGTKDNLENADRILFFFFLRSFSLCFCLLSTFALSLYGFCTNRHSLSLRTSSPTQPSLLFLGSPKFSYLFNNVFLTTTFPTFAFVRWIHGSTLLCFRSHPSFDHMKYHDFDRIHDNLWAVGKKLWIYIKTTYTHGQLR